MKEIEISKNRAKWGCISWAILLFFGPFLLFTGIFYFHMAIKEETLLISQSPNKVKTITIVEKGEPAFFGPSTIRIKHGWDQIERTIYNDGKTLYETNFQITWENDDRATITLYGEEQQPESITFDAEESKPFKLEQNRRKEPVDEPETELGYFTFKTSESPNLINIIELREVVTSSGTSTMRIYYGKRGSIIEKYKEHIPTDMYTPDNFKVSWISDKKAVVDVIRQNAEGNDYIEETIEIDLDV
jgi:hypothetical protein